MTEYAEDIIVDKKDQLEKIESVIGITDKRIIYYDKAFLKAKKALVSIPYDRIASVASEDNRGFIIKKGFLVSDTLTIQPIGSKPKTFEFRGGDKAHIAHNIIMEHLLR